MSGVSRLEHEPSCDIALHKRIHLGFFCHTTCGILGFPGGSDGKEPAYNAGDPGSNLGLRISPGKGNGNPLQYSCLENPMDRGAWQVTVHGVARVRHDLATKPTNIIFAIGLH